MDRLTKTIFAALAGLLVIFALLLLCIERVPVRTYGVKQFIWAGGIESKDYATGYHIGITGIHKWHLLDSSTHFLEFVDAGERGGIFTAKRGSLSSMIPISKRSADDLGTPVFRTYAALEIRNRDGNVVTLDVSVPYRIIPQHAHKIVSEGLKATYQDRVKATVESVLREVLPEMSNEALQDTEKRLATSAKALETLNVQLAQFHVVAENVLIRKVSFPPEYETKLQEKQLFAQKALLDQAETLKLVEVQRTGTIDKEIVAAEAQSTADWEKKTETLTTEYTLKAASIKADAVQASKRIRAEGDATHQTKLAEGALAVDRAKALLDELRTTALNAPGGEYYLARLAVENLDIERVTLDAADERVPMILDLDSIVELLLGRAREAQTGTVPPPASPAASAAPSPPPTPAAPPAN